jgi:methylase of polypeptide subunit release factors
VLGWSRPYRDGVLPAEIDALLLESGLREDAGQDGEAGHRARIRASTIGRQLYFHSAFPTDEDDAVFFGPDTYRYVAALKRALASPLLGRPVRRAVDIGCGAGPAAIELALCRPEATVYAADINEDALALTEINAELNGAARLIPCRSNLLDGVDGHFDLVMSNPPYILDPEVAIAGGRDSFLDNIRPLLDDACDEWLYEELDPDIFGGQLDCEGYEDVERIAAVWLHAVKRG